MARRTGRDPPSVQLHTGPELPPRRPWVDPVPTTHLFHARPAPGARSVRVEATGGWGRRWPSEVTLAG
jgi:hypothetical protein